MIQDFKNIAELKAEIETCNRALDLNPEDAASYFNRGVAHLKLESYDAAIEDFEELTEFDPECAEAYCYLGVAKAKLHEYEEAIEDFNEAIALNPEYAEAYYYRGAAKDADAVKDLKKAGELGYVKAYELIGQIQGVGTKTR